VRGRWRALLTLIALFGCGGTKAPAPPAGGASPGAAAPAAGDLSAFEVENGIGPMTAAVTVGSIDAAMAAAGKKTFDTKCAACHKLDQRYVGPSLGGVTVRRTPTYVMNMVLNPQGMTDRHPVAKGLLGEFMTQMPNLALTQDEARQVMEYLRQNDSKAAGK
jgi:mono/diheme cytochrome c family protein